MCEKMHLSINSVLFAVNLFGRNPTQSRVDLGAILGGLAQTVASQGQNGPQIQGRMEFNNAEVK